MGSLVRPRRAVAPVAERLSRERAGRLKVAKLNADAAPVVSQRLRVSSIPALVLFQHGRERARIVGAQPHAAISRWLDEHVRAD